VGRTGRGPLWIIAGTPLGAPYPCRCNLGRSGVCRCGDPDRVRLVVADGWPLCPCTGQPWHDGLPDGCCRASGRIVADPVAPSPDSGPVVTRELVMATDAGIVRLTLPAYLPAVSVAVEVPGFDDAESGWRDAIAEAREAIAANSCTCRTPWDGQPRPAGMHCVDCCHNFASWAAARMHRDTGRYDAVCRDPRGVVDVDTGRLLMCVRLECGMPVWGMSRA